MSLKRRLVFNSEEVGQSLAIPLLPSLEFFSISYHLLSFMLFLGGDTSCVNSDGDSCLYLATFATGNDADTSLVEMLIKYGNKLQILTVIKYY